MDGGVTFHKSSNVVARRIAEEYILVPIRRDIAELDTLLTLNEVGAFIWEKLDTHPRLDNLLQAVCDEFEVTPSTARNDVISFLEEMKTVGAIDFLRE